MTRFIFVLLGGAFVGLVCVDAWMWFDEDGQIKNSKWTAPDPVRIDFGSQLTQLPAEGGIANVAFLSVTERPLFSRTRRPPLPPPPPPPPPAPVAPDIFSNAVVKGVLSYSGGSGVIIEMSGKSRRIRTGESVDGWKLTRIEGLSAVFTSGDSHRTIPLAKAASLKGRGAPATQIGSPSPLTVPSVPSGVVSNSPGAVEVAPASAPPRKSIFGP